MIQARVSHAKHCEASRPQLLRDTRGLSTIEYAVLFVTILIGALALWAKLGNSLGAQLGTGTNTFNSVLGAAQAPVNGTAAPGTGTAAPASSVPAAATNLVGPGAKKLQSE